MKLRYPFLVLITLGIWFSVINSRIIPSDMGLVWPTKESFMIYSMVAGVGLMISGLLESKKNLRIDLSGEKLLNKWWFYLIFSAPR